MKDIFKRISQEVDDEQESFNSSEYHYRNKVQIKSNKSYSVYNIPTIAKN